MVFQVVEQYTNIERTELVEQANSYYNYMIMLLDSVICNNDSERLIDLLCERRVDLTVALARSVLYNNVGIVNLLLYIFGADPNQALIFSIQCNNVQMAQRLMNTGVCPNRPDQNGNFPLIVASIITENIEMVKLLLKCGATPCFENEDGKTLIDAVKNEEIKKLLIEQEIKFKGEMKIMIRYAF